MENCQENFFDSGIGKFQVPSDHAYSSEGFKKKSSIQNLCKTSQIMEKETQKEIENYKEKFVEADRDRSPVLPHPPEESKNKSSKQNLRETSQIVEKETQKEMENYIKRFVDVGRDSSLVLPLAKSKKKSKNSKKKRNLLISRIEGKEAGGRLENSGEIFVGGGSSRALVSTDAETMKESSKRKRSLHKTNQVGGKRTKRCIENSKDTFSVDGEEHNSILPSSSKDQNILVRKQLSNAISQKRPIENVSHHNALSTKEKQNKDMAAPYKELRVRLFKLPYLPRKIEIQLTKLPNVIYDKYKKGKPIMLSKVVPQLQTDININSEEVIEITSNVLHINASMQPEDLRTRSNELLYLPKQLKVNLTKLPDYIYNNHVKGKPIMLSNILPTISRVESVPIFNSFIKTEDCSTT
ncbi:hypothetical protein JTE90_025934 [Oedothorax gibbosus]|nr:hypothetical protein JTE90_025934 [Oedothorax gibbosus]